jgi:hypothetical protein
MFVQHHFNTAFVSTPIHHSTADFDLVVLNKTKEALHGKVGFVYLQQKFEAKILVTATTIQITATHPLSGISSSAPDLSNAETSKEFYLFNGNLTAKGSQNIIWLILDIVHLYNLLRLKPTAIIDLYREAFLLAKVQNESVVFGNIQQEETIIKSIAKKLAQIFKLKFKYAYSNPIDLLISIEQIVSNYPQAFLTSKSQLKNLEPIHS